MFVKTNYWTILAANQRKGESPEAKVLIELLYVSLLHYEIMLI